MSDAERIAVVLALVAATGLFTLAQYALVTTRGGDVPRRRFQLTLCVALPQISRRSLSAWVTPAAPA
jgi:hypothetical protein